MYICTYAYHEEEEEEEEEEEKCMAARRRAWRQPMHESSVSFVHARMYVSPMERASERASE